MRWEYAALLGRGQRDARRDDATRQINLGPGHVVANRVTRFTLGKPCHGFSFSRNSI
jgi:hypothetical protein